MDNGENILKLNEALFLLNDKNVLITIFLNQETYVMKVDEIYKIKNNSVSLSLKESEFVDIFKNSLFKIYEEETNVDPQKDKEYYSWKQ